MDATAICEALYEQWDALKAAIQELPVEEQKELRDHFNDKIEGEDDLGDMLFGDDDEFDSKIKFLNEAVLKQLTEEMITTQLIDKDALFSDDY